MSFLLAVFANLLLLLAAFGTGGVLRPFLPTSFSKLDRIPIIVLAGLGISRHFSIPPGPGPIHSRSNASNSSSLWFFRY